MEISSVVIGFIAGVAAASAIIAAIRWCAEEEQALSDIGQHGGGAK